MDTPQDVADGTVPGVKRAAIRKLRHEVPPSPFLSHRPQADPRRVPIPRVPITHLCDASTISPT